MLLRTLTEPYASVRVAVYEPLILRWLSVPGIVSVLDIANARYASKRTGDVGGGAAAPTIARFDWRAPAASRAGVPADRAVTSARRGPPMLVTSRARTLSVSKEEQARRRAIVRDLVLREQLTTDELVNALTDGEMPHLLSVSGLGPVLSPIGVLHLYRQLYFDLGAGLGPLEHAFTVAPNEEMQVIQEVTRRESVERTEMLGTESTLEKTAEESTLDEISDYVQTALYRDMQVGMSAAAGGNFGVWSASAAASVDLAVSTEHAREVTRTNTVSQTRKSSEILRKSYSLTVKSFTELSERSTVKRTIRNEGPDPVNYGLRRVLRTVRVKLQSLGPRLCWQLYVKRPGERLALSKLVMFREADPVAPAEFPNAPPRPPSGTEEGSQTLSVQAEGGVHFIEVVVPAHPARTYTGLVVGSITDMAPEKDSTAPAVVEATAVAVTDATASKYTLSVTGSASVVSITYTLHYGPSDAVLTEWSKQVLAAQEAWEAEQQETAFDRAKRVILAKSHVRPRPGADLRDEERYEILNRMISEAFHDAPKNALPSPAEIELFHRYFDISAMFHYVHPAWWMPRYGVARADYEITDDSEPARFGKSLGWVIQLDGDRRRNEFLNSPWIRACLPIRPGMEHDAIAWLATHVEGKVGLSTAPESPVGRLLADVEARREIEHIGTPGPDYVTLDGSVAPSREAAATAYPVVDEFEVVVPTEGFIYERIETE